MALTIKADAAKALPFKGEGLGGPSPGPALELASTGVWEPDAPAPEPAGTWEPEAPHTESTPPPALQPQPYRWTWLDMDTAPRDRPIYITTDPDEDRDGTLAYWRHSRVKINGRKGWHNTEYWASVLTNRQLEGVPFCWREAMAGAAVEAGVEAA